MTDIYKQRQRTVRTPSSPDTQTMSYFNKRREAALLVAGKQEEFIAKQEAAANKALYTNVEKAANQVYRNGYTLYQNQPDKYQEFVSDGLKEIYSTVPDSKDKIATQASVSITGSGYNAKVQKNYMDSQEQMRIEQMKKNTFTAVENARVGLPALFSIIDGNLSPEQKIQQEQSYNDSQIPLFNAYNQRLAQDNNGNFIYSVSERAQIEDSWESRHSNALIDYAGDNIITNRRGVVALRDGFLEKKKEVQEKYDISNEDYEKTISKIDKIISGQTTNAFLQKEQVAQIVNSATLKDMDIGLDGSVGESKYNNIDSLVSVYQQLKDSEDAGYYTGKRDKEKIAGEKGKVAIAINKHIEEGVDLKKETFFSKKQNVGEVAVENIIANIEKLKQKTKFQKLDQSEKDQIKANMYIEVLGSLMQAENITLDQTNNADGLMMAKKRAAESYYRQIHSIIGYVPKVNNPDDPEEVRRVHEDAMLQDNNQASVALFREILGIA